LRDELLWVDLRRPRQRGYLCVSVRVCVEGLSVVPQFTQFRRSDNTRRTTLNIIQAFLDGALN
jgi:hypothetical protein